MTLCAVYILIIKNTNLNNLSRFSSSEIVLIAKIIYLTMINHVSRHDLKSGFHPVLGIFLKISQNCLIA
jgi:hypothetical protein